MTEAWTPSTIGELFDIGAGKAMTPQARNHAELTPFLRTANVFWGKISLEELDRMHFTDGEFQAKNLKSGDLLVCEGGDIGRAAIWNGELERCCFQNHLHRLRPKTTTTVPRFYMYYLQAGFTQSGLYEGAGNKTTIPNLSRNRLSALAVPKLDEDEQRKIAAVLWKIQRAIEVEEKLTATARELKQSAMRRLFTRGLRGESQQDTYIGPTPESWDVVPLEKLARIGNGSTPLKRNLEYWTNGTIPWLTSAKVYDVTVTKADQFVTPKAVKECHLPRVNPGSVLMAITGQGKTLGNVAVTDIETCVSQHIAYMQFHDERANPHFIRLFLETRYDELRAIAQGGGSTKGALTCGFLKSYHVPLPKRPEQDEIVQSLMAIERKVDVHSRKTHALHELFKTMLHRLMAGEIRVADWDIDVSEVTA